ncbi:MAG: DUF3810 domain-containing protein [Bacillaceae bacterium]
MRKLKYMFIALLPIAFIIKYFFSLSPTITENVYSTKINKMFIEGLSKLTGLFPFSLHEFGIYVLVVVGVTYLIFLIRKLVRLKKERKRTLYDALLTVVAAVSVFFFLFTINWGINYNRIPFESTIGLQVTERSVADVGKLYELLIEKANTLRTQVEVDEQGIMTTNGNYKSVLKRAQKGYDAVEQKYPTLAGNYGAPKPIMASELMNYTGITGVYSPFTGEANVNIAQPIMSLPFTTMHEMAHQRGYSSENEANFIGFLTSIHHPDVDFQYTGYLMALSYTRNALAQNDIELLKQLDQKLSEGVKKDIAYKYEFWTNYDGTISNVSDSVNNSFLKLNGVKDGVRSYGRIVDLLLAYYV